MTKDQIHTFRKEIDACIKTADYDLNGDESRRPNYKREIALVRTKLQEAKMWAGKCLEAFPDNDFPKELKDEAGANQLDEQPDKKEE